MTKKITSFAMALTAALAFSGFMAGDADAQVRTAAERQAFRAQQRSDRIQIRSINKRLNQRTRQLNTANRQAWRAAGRPDPVGFRAAQANTRQRTACYKGALRTFKRTNRQAFRAGVADYRGQASRVAGNQIAACP
jgi:hypothetical protein